MTRRDRTFTLKDEAAFFARTEEGYLKGESWQARANALPLRRRLALYAAMEAGGDAEVLLQEAEDESP